MLPNLFIVGVGRSGTSLLQSMLGAHPKITLLPETQFVRRFVIKRRFTKSLDYRNHEKMQRLAVDDHILRGEPLEVLEKICSVKIKRGDKFIGIKDPKLLDNIDTLKKIFYSPSICVMIRDPRAVVSSRTKADWSKSKPYYLHAFLYSHQMRRYLRRNREGIHEVIYEKLLENPRETLESVNDYLGIEYSENQMNYQKTSKELVSSDEMQWKKETLGPLLTNNAVKWNKVLSTKQIAVVEYICEKEMFQLGYNRVQQERLNKPERLVLSLGKKIFGLIYEVRLFL